MTVINWEVDNKLLAALAKTLDEDGRERKPLATMADIWEELNVTEKDWIAHYCGPVDMAVLALMPISKVFSKMYHRAYNAERLANQSASHTHGYSGVSSAMGIGPASASALPPHNHGIAAQQAKAQLTQNMLVIKHGQSIFENCTFESSTNKPKSAYQRLLKSFWP